MGRTLSPSTGRTRAPARMSTSTDLRLGTERPFAQGVIANPALHARSRSRSCGRLGDCPAPSICLRESPPLSPSPCPELYLTRIPKARTRLRLCTRLADDFPRLPVRGYGPLAHDNPSTFHWPSLVNPSGAGPLTRAAPCTSPSPKVLHPWTLVLLPLTNVR